VGNVIDGELLALVSAVQAGIQLFFDFCLKARAFAHCASESLLCSCIEVTKKARLFFTYGVFAKWASVSVAANGAHPRAPSALSEFV
jgi:hypothetical protein